MVSVKTFFGGFYMTIGEISKKTGLPESTLRYYERKGLILVTRDRSGRRAYLESDVEWVKFICRLKETGMPLRDIQRYAELRYAGDATMRERLDMLQLHREYVLEQQRKWAGYLQNLDDKIRFYQRSINRQ